MNPNSARPPLTLNLNFAVKMSDSDGIQCSIQYSTKLGSLDVVVDAWALYYMYVKTPLSCS